MPIENLNPLLSDSAQLHRAYLIDCKSQSGRYSFFYSEGQGQLPCLRIQWLARNFSQ